MDKAFRPELDYETQFLNQWNYLGLKIASLEQGVCRVSEISELLKYLKSLLLQFIVRNQNVQEKINLEVSAWKDAAQELYFIDIKLSVMLLALEWNAQSLLRECYVEINYKVQSILKFNRIWLKQTT